MSSLGCYIFIVFSIFFSSSLVAQNNLPAYDSLGKAVLVINNGLLSSIHGDTLTPIFNVKGNIVFSNSSENRADILYLVKGTSIFSKKGGQFISSANNKPIFTFNKGKLYLGNSIYDKRMLLGYFEETENNQTAFFSVLQSKPLFHLDTTNISVAQLLTTAFYFIQLYEIDKQLFALNNSNKPMVEGTGTIRKLWGNNNQDYIWDGKILRNRWNNNEFEQWTFDGTYISRAYFDTGEDFEWDGTTLQSRWNMNGQAYTLQGSSIKAIYGNNNDEFFIQGNIIKRAWTAVGNDEWEVNGEIPIPILMMVVFRIIR